MDKVIDISYLELFIGYALLLIPIFVLWYYKTGMVKDTLIAVARMTVQLLLVGVYLEYIFKLNNAFINLGWVLIMLLIETYTIIRRTGLRYKLFIFPVFISGLISIAVTDAFFLGLVIKLDNIFDARYFIPITGMLMGNTLRTVIIALDAYYAKIETDENQFRWYLANGATQTEALHPFIRDALKLAFNPTIATTAVMGLISLPGMMTGQILGGSDPGVAVKYQIMLVITIFSSGMMNVILCIILSNRFAFDTFGNLKKVIFRR
jgi:putative ABC transport system permease protein